jgi:hypothetical protein
MRLERRDRLSFIEPDVFIELRRQHRFEIVTDELASGPINHANGPLKPWLQETFGVSGLAVAQTKRGREGQFYPIRRGRPSGAFLYARLARPGRLTLGFGSA